jgi:hypothetical protein
MKNLLFSFVALLYTLPLVAQLSVQPDGADASYIYVKDELLFVKGDIVLSENPSGDTNASIYFRDGAQLIQEDDVQNTGTGYISILQTNPDSDAWDYAFWSSPVGDQTIGGGGNKNFGATRFFNPDNLLSTASEVNAPTNALNGIETPMRISRRWLYTYTFADGWSRINDNSAVLPGRGFTMKGLGTTNHDQTYDFRGRPNNGNITTPITAGEYNLTGNPYPSALDLRMVYFDPDNTALSEIYYWDENHNINSHYYVDNQGGYGTWIPGPDETSNGEYTVPTFLSYDDDGNPILGSNNGQGASYPRRYAPVGQGFMLFGSSSGTVTYKNSHRINEKIGGSSIFRGPQENPDTPRQKSPATSIIPVTSDYEHSKFRINTYINNSHGRQLLLLLSEESTDGYDRGLDGRSPMDSTSDAYFPIELENQEVFPYVIQTIPYSIKKQIPYTLVLEDRATIVITLEEKVNFDGPIYFYDNLEETYQRILNPYQKGETAKLKLPAGIYEDRFFLSFSNEHREQEIVNENAKKQILENLDFFQNNPIRQLEVANPERYDIALANIFDMSGKLVYTSSNLGSSSKFTFPTGNLSEGIYLVMLTTTTNIAVNYKITVNNN